MKKILILLLAMVTISSLMGCSMERCDICNERGAEHEVKVVSTWILCDDCYYEQLSRYDLDYDDLDYDYDDDDIDYDYDDFDYDDLDDYTGRCIDCGTSIPSDRIYCDNCLGFGTCQDCGKSIDSDSLYCDTCLGFGTCQDCGKSIDSDSLYCDTCLGFGTCQDCGRSIDSDSLYCDSCLFD